MFESILPLSKPCAKCRSGLVSFSQASMKISAPVRPPDPGAMNDFGSHLTRVRYDIVMGRSWCVDFVNIEVRKKFDQ